MNVKTLLGSLLVAATAISPALAQTYPVKPISLIVPYPAGGPSDFFARKVQPEATAKLGKTVVVENLGGAICHHHHCFGGAQLAQRQDRGRTPGLGAQKCGQTPELRQRGSRLALPPDWREILATDPGGDAPCALKGIAPLLNDLMGGQIDMAFLPMAGSIPQTVIDGKIQGLAVNAKTPHPLFKQFPAMANMKGLEAMEFDIWAGVQVHKNTPEAVVNTLNKAFYAAVEAPETRKALEGSGNLVLPSRTPAELARIYLGDIERYRATAKSINLQVQSSTRPNHERPHRRFPARQTPGPASAGG